MAEARGASRREQAAPPAPDRPVAEPVLKAPVQATFVPTPAPAVARSARSARTAAPATNQAVIVFANAPGTHCGACETLKFSVAPSGTVLIERGYWDSDHHNWHYKRSVAHVGQARAADFAGRLDAYRLTGEQLSAGAPACPASPSEDDGLTVDWIEAGRHDQLAFPFGCAARRDSPLVETLRHAPDVLGLRRFVFPWGDGR